MLYTLKSVLHDWSDKKCFQILKGIEDGMEPHSKILIVENVIPQIGCNSQMAALSIIVLSLFNSYERTEKEWYRLIGEAGLKIVEIHRGANDTSQCVIEVTK